MNKICTSLEQSKKLIELGIDIKTADMRYGYIAPYDYSDRMYDGGYDEIPYPKDFLKKNPNFSENEYDGELPAWSIAALLENIPVSCDDGQHCFALINCNPKGDTEWLSCYEDCKGNLLNECYSDNPIDACVEMITKLKEKGIL